MSPGGHRLAIFVAVLLTARIGVAGAQDADHPAWLTVDGASRTVTLALEVTALPGSASAGINGFREGGIQIVVPPGWTIRWTWVSHDTAGLHSLLVGPEREKLPERAQSPAFPNAMTRNALAGLAAGRLDATSFEADQTGWFWLYCGVPDHALRGEWIGLRVNAQAKEPSVVVKTREVP